VPGGGTNQSSVVAELGDEHLDRLREVLGPVAVECLPHGCEEQVAVAADTATEHDGRGGEEERQVRDAGREHSDDLVPDTARIGMTLVDQLDDTCAVSRQSGELGSTAQRGPGSEVLEARWLSSSNGGEIEHRVANLRQRTRTCDQASVEQDAGADARWTVR
jgi:hypothetical protein